MHLLLHNGRRHRVRGAMFAVSFVIALLMTAFFAVQVRGGETYEATARGNRLRPIVIPAPRGTIVDRHGAVIATSLTEYAVAVAPGEEGEVRRTLDALAPILGLTGEGVAKLMDRRARRPHALLDVTHAATYAQAAAIAERQASFSGVMVTERPLRHYPAGPATAHLVGYTGEITRAELDRTEFAGYRQGQRIGKAGTERRYEDVLAGRDGARFVEVDARGRVMRGGAEAGRTAPVAGGTLALTVDLALQEYVHEIFPDSMRGALVAMEPSTGEVLALYSNPTFDPNALSGGRIPPALWATLQTDADKPLLNRAVTALYPPASTWKLATAAIAVRRGVAAAGTRMPLPCNGGMAYAGRYARCHESSGHGAVDLAGAIEESCNVYFYQLGIQLGLAELAEAGTRLGFGRRTGIDLPGESQPRFPTGRDWYRRAFGQPAVPSEVMSLAIGQGPNSQTVLRMAAFYGALAGDGTSRTPHLVRGAAGPEPAVDLGLDEAGMQALWSGLARVSEGPSGTARGASLQRWKLFGKTGTAQNSQGADHGWFVGFAGPPGGHAEIVVAVIVEHGLHGGDVAPLAAKAIDFYLNRRHGLPVDPRPTLLERWNDGRTPWDRYDAHLNPPRPRPQPRLRQTE